MIRYPSHAWLFFIQTNVDTAHEQQSGYSTFPKIESDDDNNTRFIYSNGRIMVGTYLPKFRVVVEYMYKKKKIMIF